MNVFVRAALLLLINYSIEAAVSKNSVHDFAKLVEGGKNALEVFNKLTDGSKNSLAVLNQKASAPILPIVVKCYMNGCGPCRATELPYQKMADDYAGKAHFVTIDVVKFDEIGKKLAISSVPRFFVFLPNKKVINIGGSTKVQEIRAILDQNPSKPTENK